jgi:hypothetical protein
MLATGPRGQPAATQAVPNVVASRLEYHDDRRDRRGGQPLHTADSEWSNPHLAGPMLRCGKQGVEVIVVGVASKNKALRDRAFREILW